MKRPSWRKHQTAWLGSFSEVFERLNPQCNGNSPAAMPLGPADQEPEYRKPGVLKRAASARTVLRFHD
jgi:hypothetical protein